MSPRAEAPRSNGVSGDTPATTLKLLGVHVATAGEMGDVMGGVIVRIPIG